MFHECGLDPLQSHRNGLSFFARRRKVRVDPIAHCDVVVLDGHNRFSIIRDFGAQAMEGRVRSLAVLARLPPLLACKAQEDAHAEHPDFERDLEERFPVRDSGLELTDDEIAALTSTDRELWKTGVGWIDARLQRCCLKSRR